MARTPRITEDRREQIIDAAMRVFAQKGFARATNRDIAHEAGITSGLIYYYFKSKEDLLKAALEERSPVQVMTQISPDMLEQPPEIFLPILAARVLNIVENPQFVGMIRVLLPEVLHGSTEIAPLIAGFLQRVIAFLNAYLQNQLVRGTVRADLAVEMTTQIIVSSIMGMVLRRQVMHDPSILRYTHEEMIRALMDIVMQGIRPC